MLATGKAHPFSPSVPLEVDELNDIYGECLLWFFFWAR